MKTTVILSVIVPVHNESAVLQPFIAEIIPVLRSLKLSYELIFVDDGSTDTSLNIITSAAQDIHEIRWISLSRCFGKEAAMTAGLDEAYGQAIVLIDADLQDPPSLISDMVQLWKTGAEVVIATRRHHAYSEKIRALFSRMFYRVLNHFSDVPIPVDTGDFRLMDRKVVAALLLLPERRRFLKGLFAWVGFKTTAIYFDRPLRTHGKSKWNLWQLWNFGLDGIFAFSSLPLRIWSYVGFLCSISAFLYGSFLIVRTLIYGIDLPGYASLMVSILFLNGLVMVSLGILGEYVGRIYEEVKQRPLYIKRKEN